MKIVIIIIEIVELGGLGYLTYDWAYQLTFGGDSVPYTDSGLLFDFPHHCGIGDFKRFIRTEWQKNGQTECAARLLYSVASKNVTCIPCNFEDSGMQLHCLHRQNKLSHLQLHSVTSTMKLFGSSQKRQNHVIKWTTLYIFTLWSKKRHLLFHWSFYKRWPISIIFSTSFFLFFLFYLE